MYPVFLLLHFLSPVALIRLLLGTTVVPKNLPISRTCKTTLWDAISSNFLLHKTESYLDDADVCVHQ